MKYRKALPIFMLAGCISLSACTAEKQTQVTQKALTAVEATKMSSASIKKEMVYAGQVSPSRSVSVISKITGKVQEYYFDIGDEVKENDILFKLDEKDIQNQITQIQAQMNQTAQGIRTAQNAVNSVTGGQYQSQILQQEAAIENYAKQLVTADNGISLAEIALENANKTLENTQQTYDNTKALFEIDAVSKADFDKVDLGLAQAQAGLEKAKNDYNQALIGKEQLLSAKKTAEEGLSLVTGQITQDNRRSAQLALDTAMAGANSLQVQMDLATDTLNDTNVAAPMTGIISARNAKTDEYITNQVPAYTIIDIDTVNIDVKVSELLINSIYTGQEVEVLIGSVSTEVFVATIETISPAADQTGTFPVKIKLNNPGHVIKPGMFAEVHFVREMSENTIVLPRNTVLSDESGSYVFVNSNGVAKKIAVETGIDNGESIEIISGVSLSDEVITKGHTYIIDAEEINVVTVWGE